MTDENVKQYTPLEKQLEVSYNVAYLLNDQATPLLYPRGMKHAPKDLLHINVHGRFICNSFSLETSQTPTKG